MMHQTISIFLLAAVAVMVLPGCGNDLSGHEEVIESLIAQMDEMTTILEGITDVASVEAARTKLLAVSMKLNKLSEKKSSLSDLSKAEMKSLDERYEARVRKSMNAMLEQTRRIEMEPQVDEKLKEILSEVDTGS